MMESKKKIYNIIPQQYYPKTLLFSEGATLENIQQTIADAGMTFPLIAKPDIGMRGAAVRRIENKESLKTYFEKATFDFLIQDLIPYQNEAGIFYVRMPNEPKGRITGIVAKEFLIVTGDGKSTLKQLVERNPRFALQLKPLTEEYGDELERVPEIDENVNLVPFGNHCRGSKFIDATDRVSLRLTETINKMCLQIPGFHFGRIDIMFNSFEELERGEKFSVVELNGAGSEPTHIYDPEHSVFFAWKEIARHIGLMYKAGKQNNEAGVPYIKYKDGMEQFRLHKIHNRKIAAF